MSAVLRGVMSRTTPVLRTNLTQKSTIVSGPPRVRVSLAEKVTIGIVMTLAIVSPAGYIMANLLNYRSRPGTEE